jgi:hypothetical protein
LWVIGLKSDANLHYFCISNTIHLILYPIFYFFTFFSSQNGFSEAQSGQKAVFSKLNRFFVNRQHANDAIIQAYRPAYRQAGFTDFTNY